MTVDLSIVIPSIRVENWPLLLRSIEESCTKHTYEVIFVGPKSYGFEFDKNIRFVQDFGSPNRCQQMGASLATGDVVFCGADDCVFVANGIDQCMQRLLDSKNDVLTCNYTEAGNKAVTQFSLRHNYPPCKQIRYEWVIFNNAFIQRKALEEVGGYDCRFQVTCLGHADLACRMQYLGFKVDTFDFELMHCSHEPGQSGTHGPIHVAQLLEDIPLYQAKYDLTAMPCCTINMDNWKQAQPIWSKRYE